VVVEFYTEREKLEARKTKGQFMNRTSVKNFSVMSTGQY
jgi:hypothetical protein